MTSVFDYIRQKKQGFQERQVEVAKARSIAEEREMQNIVKERQQLQASNKTHERYEQEKSLLANERSKAPKTGLNLLFQKAGQGAKKLREEREKFRKENPNFGKSRGVFAELGTVNSNQKIQEPQNQFGGGVFGQNLTKPVAKTTKPKGNRVIITKTEYYK